MSRFNYTCALGDNLPPNAPIKHYIATEALIGAGIGVASLAGSLYSQYQNLKSQADSNEMNYKIHQEDLEAQRQMWRNSQMENRFLVDQAYERNLPKNVVKNLKEAGINPAFAFNSGAFGSVPAQVGNAPSPSSVPSGAPMQPTRQADLGQGISQAYSNYLLSEKQSADISAEKRRLDMQELDLWSRIDSSKIANDKVKAEIDNIRQDLSFNRNSEADRLESIKLANSKIKADTAYQEELTKSAKIANDFAPELHDLEKQRLQSEIMQGVAAAAQLRAQQHLSEKEADLVCKKISEQVIRNSNLPKTLHNENAIQVATYNHIKSQSRLINQQTESEKWNTIDLMKEGRFKKGSRPLSDYVQYGADALESLSKGEKHFKIVP